MRRKDFIKNSLVVLGGLPLAARSNSFTNDEDTNGEIFSKKIQPPYLKPGDTIGITAPSGNIDLNGIQSAINQFKLWDWNVRVGTATIGTGFGSLSAPANLRIQELNDMLRDDNIQAIMCARGGYGLVEIIDAIDMDALRSKPKWIIGFSDTTVLHCHINRNAKIASIHSKMCNSFPENIQTIPSIQKDAIDSIRIALQGEKKMSYTALPSLQNKLGDCKGELIGGNLRTIENLVGTHSDIKTKNKILFIEDVLEPLYNIDRMLCNLLRTGKLKDLSGLLVGGFRLPVDNSGDPPFPFTLQEIILNKIKEFDFPVAFNFPVGHQIDNFALKCGVQHQLTVTNNLVTLKEL